LEFNEHIVSAEQIVRLHRSLLINGFQRSVLGATGVSRLSSEVRFILVPMNLFANRFLVEFNQMLGCVTLLSDMVVTTTPLTNLRVVMAGIFLGNALAFVRILIFLKMILIFLVPLSLEILFEFLATKLLLIVLTIVVTFR